MASIKDWSIFVGGAILLAVGTAAMIIVALPFQISLFLKHKTKSIIAEKEKI